MKTIKRAKISETSTENFYDVTSSNGWDHYPLEMTGPGACTCGCPAGSVGRNCYHRTYALETLVYIFPDAAYRFQVIEDGLKEINEVLAKWQAVEEQAETDMELDAYRVMIESEAA